MARITGWERLVTVSVFVSNILSHLEFRKWLHQKEKNRLFNEVFGTTFYIHYHLSLSAIYRMCHVVGANIDPNLLLVVFLPALLFESSFLMEVHQIKVFYIYFVSNVLFNKRNNLQLAWSWCTALLILWMLLVQLQRYKLEKEQQIV